MSIFDSFLDNLAQNIADRLNSENAAAIEKRKYYIGKQKTQLKVPLNKTDDNIIVNLVGLAVDRSVTHVLAGGVEFDLPDLQVEGQEGVEQTETNQQTYIDDVWDVNRKSVLLLNAVINASVFGTGFFKIKPDGIADPYTHDLYPRLIALNPEYVTIHVDPQDQERVVAYVIQYKVGDVVYRETTRRARADDYDIAPQDIVTWIIVNEKMVEGSNRWDLIDKFEFPYNFPNIVHWKNLPSLSDINGSSDIDDILGMQDKSNATVSYIQKQVRLQQHKQPWVSGVNTEKMEIGPDAMIKIQNPEAKLGILDFQTDITGSLAFEHSLRQSLFDVAREVDITSITDKLGALTNFGLRVLYSDSLGKNDTKRMLFGEALIELNRRLLVLAGFEGELSRPGEVVWSDPLPANKTEDMQAYSEALAMGVVSKETVAGLLGYDYEKEQERMTAEKSTNDNGIGAALLRAFPPTGQPQPNNLEKGIK